VRIKSILLKTSRIIGWTLFCVLVLLITVVLLIRVPAIQNKIAQKAIAYLEEKLKTNVELERIVIDFPKKIVIEGLYLEDQKKDTLISAGRIAVDASMMELIHNKIMLNKVEISNTSGKISRTLPDSAFNFNYIIAAFASADTTNVTPVDTTSTPWTFSIGDVELENVKVVYDDSVSKMKLKADVGLVDINTDDVDLDAMSFDFDDVEIDKTNISYTTDSLQLEISDLKSEISNLKYDSTNIEADIKELSVKEKVRSLELKKLSGFAKLHGKDVELKSIEVIFGNSQINITGTGNYESLKGDITISESHIALADILLFQPNLLDSLPVNVPRETIVYIEGGIAGDTTRAEIKSFKVHTLDSTYVSLDGATDNVNFNFYTSASDIKLVLSDTLLPVTPKWLSLKGNAKGTIKRPSVVASLATDLGMVDTEGQFDLVKTPRYKAKIHGKSIHAGKLSGQTALGDVNFHLDVDGSGSSMKDIHTKVDLIVDDIVYSHYRFRDFRLNGSVDKFLFSGKAKLNDENLDFELNADVDYNGDIPVYKAQLDLKNADLKELNLSEMPLKARLTVDVDMTTSDFKVMNGRLDIRKVGVFNGEKLYAVDSMLFASLDQKGHSKMSIRSDILTGDFEGSFNIFSVGDVIQHHFARYFSNGKKKTEPEGPPQNFTFDLKIKNTDLITEVLVPKLEPFTPGVIRGQFDSEEHRFNIVFRMPKIKYDNISVDSLVFLLKSDADELTYFTKLERLLADTIVIHQINLAGNMSRDSIRAALNVLDSLREKQYRIGAEIVRRDDMMRVHVTDSLLLNYSAWNVPHDNYLAVGEKAIVANNFEIIKDRQKVIFLGDTRKDAAVTVRFEELELGNLTRIISGIVPASGELNGDFKFNTSGSGEFNSKLTVSGLTVLQKPVGDLTLQLNHSKDKYNVTLGLRGNRTNMETKGTYGGPKGAEALDLVANISQLNMEVLQAFSMGQLSGAEGALKGRINIKGKPSHPDIDGNITFANVSIVPTYLNSKFVMTNETIELRNDNIALNSFTIADAGGNKAVLKGNINIAKYTNPVFDLTLDAKDFQLIDTKEGDNELFYGRVKINSTARINGSARQPKANFKLAFTDDTNFTYVVPTSEKGVMEAKGIVNFVDKDAANDPFLKNIDASDSVNTTFAGMEVSAVIDLTGKETLNIVIDPITGDKLSIQGNSSLTFDMTSSGNMNLAGRYEIDRGSYNFSFYNLVKRKFDITKGSTITWSGEPLNATMDIRASNTVDASPLELLSTAADANTANNFNQRLPFLVYLNIKGLLLAPQISFSLDVPADKRNAFGGMLYSKLQDINSRESDLNKQVFALLILRRFVSDNPLESSTGSTNAARTSVSRILSEQLNRLSSNVKGVQLSVDIKSYEDLNAQGAAQGTTKAQLGVTKSLFGNRLVVKLSGNVDIEGENAGSNNVTDYIGDLALEYKMTEDGRFRVTGFRNSNYDMIDGELTETGAGLIYIKDYNTLRELFKANETQNP
jgi:translocation and assembly module TamB